MPIIGADVSHLVWPGSPYNGWMVQQALIDLNNKAANPMTRQSAVDTLKQMGDLPQFKGIGWQGLVGMLGMIGGGALGAALGGGTTAGTSGLDAISTGMGGQLTGGTVGIGAGAAGNAMEIPSLAGIGGAGAAGGLLGLTPAQTAILTAGLSTLGGALNNTTGARTGTATSTISPEFQGLAGMLRQRAMDRLM